MRPCHSHAAGTCLLGWLASVGLRTCCSVWDTVGVGLVLTHVGRSGGSSQSAWLRSFRPSLFSWRHRCLQASHAPSSAGFAAKALLCHPFPFAPSGKWLNICLLGVCAGRSFLSHHTSGFFTVGERHPNGRPSGMKAVLATTVPSTGIRSNSPKPPRIRVCTRAHRAFAGKVGRAALFLPNAQACARPVLLSHSFLVQGPWSFRLSTQPPPGQLCACLELPSPSGLFVPQRPLCLSAAGPCGPCTPRPSWNVHPHPPHAWAFARKVGSAATFPS